MNSIRELGRSSYRLLRSQDLWRFATGFGITTVGVFNLHLVPQAMAAAF